VPPTVRLLIAATCLAIAACTPGLSSSSSASSTHDPGNVACPSGKSDRAGLLNFGAYIGTWQNNRRHDSPLSGDYVIGMVPGYVAVRCSNDGFVVQEEIHPRFQSPAGQALRIALTEIPDDSNEVYDHAHAGCRVFQYSSTKLAHQLGADDADGRVNIVFEGDSGTYNPAAVRVILMDLYDRLGADTRGC
jgi:hypothetical protein